MENVSSREMDLKHICFLFFICFQIIFSKHYLIETNENVNTSNSSGIDEFDENYDYEYEDYDYSNYEDFVPYDPTIEGKIQRQVTRLKWVRLGGKPVK